MKSLAIEKVLWLRPGEGIAACGRIPREAEFFKDHFPGFPVLPGVLALEMLKQSAEWCLRTVHAAGPRRFLLRQMRGVKFTKFLKPGDEWESRVELISEQGNLSHWNGRLASQGSSAAAARFALETVRQPKPEAVLLPY